MSIRLSHSAKQKYLTCGQMYKYHYIERIRSVTMSSALLFGSAMDVALNYTLEHKDEADVLEKAQLEFARNFEQGKNSIGEIVDLPLNPNIKYFKSDWDHDLLDKYDWAELLKYNSNFFDMKNRVDEELKSKKDWLDIPEEDRMLYNYAIWKCLSFKAKLLIEAYYHEILPNFKRILAVQKDIELDDGEGNILTGVIDFIAELQDGTIAIIDNKTSSEEYNEDSVAVSEQLATYQQVMNIFAEDPDHEWKHKIDLCGYAVLSKKLEKNITKTCKDCGHINTSTHKLCDNIINKKRCNGEFDKVKEFKVKTQFITGKVSEEYAQAVLENATVVKSCIEMSLFPKNYANCQNQFGQPCVYFNKCHGGEAKGLVKLEKK